MAKYQIFRNNGQMRAIEAQNHESALHDVLGKGFKVEEVSSKQQANMIVQGARVVKFYHVEKTTQSLVYLSMEQAERIRHLVEVNIKGKELHSSGSIPLFGGKRNGRKLFWTVNVAWKTGLENKVAMEAGGFTLVGKFAYIVQDENMTDNYESYQTPKPTDKSKQKVFETAIKETSEGVEEFLYFIDKCVAEYRRSTITLRGADSMSVYQSNKYKQLYHDMIAEVRPTKVNELCKVKGTWYPEVTDGYCKPLDDTTFFILQKTFVDGDNGRDHAVFGMVIDTEDYSEEQKRDYLAITDYDEADIDEELLTDNCSVALSIFEAESLADEHMMLETFVSETAATEFIKEFIEVN